MASFRRNVEATMSAALYRKLGAEPNLEFIWRCLRNFIGNQLFESDYVTVPFIDSAIYFNQLFVFIKKRTVSI